jgi:hypothetical protein
LFGVLLLPLFICKIKNRVNIFIVIALQPNVQIYREFLILLQSLIIIKNNLKTSKLVNYRNAARDVGFFNENEMQPEIVGDAAEEQQLLGIDESGQQAIEMQPAVEGGKNVDGQELEDSSHHSLKSEKGNRKEDGEIKAFEEIETREKMASETRSHSSRSRPKSRPQTGSTGLHRQPSTIVMNEPDQAK